MFESMGVFFAGLLLSWPAFIGLLVLGVIFEHNEARGWSVFIALASAAVAYFFFNVTLLAIAEYAVAYLVVGLFWSFWRYKRHAQAIVAQYKDCNSDHLKEVALRDLHPRAMLPTITAWIIVWPFSMVENIAGDIINAVQTLVQKVFRGIYHRIYNAAAAELSPK